MNNIWVLLILSLTLSAAGCASAKKEAEEAMEAGNYDDAVARYDKIVAEDPTDADANAGLTRARKAWIGKKLIQVRMQRLASSPPESLLLLKFILEKETQWGLAPSGAEAYTQNEEAGFALDYAESEVASALNRNYPLLSYSFLTQNKLVLQTASDKRYENLIARTYQSGKISCTNFGKITSHKTPYFKNFLARYCSLWGVPLKTSSSSLSSELFHGLQIEFEKENFPAENKDAIRALLNTSFKETAWYDVEGKQLLPFTVRGQFVETHAKNGIILEKLYTEKESYIESVTVQKTRQVPYEETITALDPYTHQPTPKTITQYRPETYTESQPETRYRDVHKSYRYPAWKHEQSLKIGLNGSFLLQGRSLDLSLNEAASAEGVEHSENHPEWGLTPSQPNLINSLAWGKEQAAHFSNNFKTKASELWQELYCRFDTPVSNLAESGERVAKCLKQTGAIAPKLAEDWYQKYLGLCVAEATRALK